MIQGTSFVNQNASQPINSVPRDQKRLPPISSVNNSTVMNLNQERVSNVSLPSSNMENRLQPLFVKSKEIENHVEKPKNEVQSEAKEPENEKIVKNEEIIQQDEILFNKSKLPPLTQTNEIHSNDDFQDENFDLKQNQEIKSFENNQDNKIQMNEEPSNVKEVKKQKRKKKKQTETELVLPTFNEN